MASAGLRWVGSATVWRFLESCELRFKKTLHAAEQERPDVAAERARWRELQASLQPEIALFRAHYQLGTVERTAFELTLNTGQRGGDVIAMERAHIEDGVISVVQEKIGDRAGNDWLDGRVWVPISRDLREALDHQDARQDAWIKKRQSPKKPRPVPIDVQRMILTGEKGRKLTSDAFRHLMDRRLHVSRRAPWARARSREEGRYHAWTALRSRHSTL